MGLAPAADAGLAVAGLTVRRGRTTVLDDLTLAAPAGLLTAIVGPTGAGKSALLHILAGFERAAGTILFDGQDVSRLPVRRRGFGLVQQSDVLFPHLTLAGNVAFPLRIRAVPRAERDRLVAEALDLVQLTHAAGLLPARASPAERQRAVLARATVFAPRLLLLDEPFSDQDQASRTILLAGLRRIHTLLGTTTLLATRVGADALALADRIAVLRGGTIEQHGTAEEVFERPRSLAIATLLGEINALPGRVEAIEDDIVLVRLDCGPRAEALAGPGLQPGEPCVLALRPDRIAIVPVAAAEMGEGAIDATLIEAQFAGDVFRLRLLIGSGAELVVRRPAAAGRRGLTIGQTAAIAWQPHHATAFARG